MARMGLPPVPYPPPRWTNLETVLYHGTLDRYAGMIAAGRIQVRFGKTHRDFGPGFYTTTDQRQAHSWAIQLAEQLPGTAPAVVELKVDRDRLAGLDVLGFVRGDFTADDYWSFVHYCRNGAANHARVAPLNPFYDAVYGPVAAFWNQRMIVANADQISFHTARAEGLLNGGRRRRIL